MSKKYLNIIENKIKELEKEGHEVLSRRKTLIEATNSLDSKLIEIEGGLKALNELFSQLNKK